MRSRPRTPLYSGRTLPDYAFFNREQPLGRLHHAAISRVLFIYAKLNPAIRYVQARRAVHARPGGARPI